MVRCFFPDLGYELPNIYLVAGARPNFMKIAPIIRALLAAERILAVLAGDLTTPGRDEGNSPRRSMKPSAALATDHE